MSHSVFPVREIKYNIYMIYPLASGRFLLNLQLTVEAKKSRIKYRHKFSY